MLHQRLPQKQVLFQQPILCIIINIFPTSEVFLLLVQLNIEIFSALYETSTCGGLPHC